MVFGRPPSPRSPWIRAPAQYTGGRQNSIRNAASRTAARFDFGLGGTVRTAAPERAAALVHRVRTATIGLTVTSPAPRPPSVASRPVAAAANSAVPVSGRCRPGERNHSASLTAEVVKWPKTQGS